MRSSLLSIACACLMVGACAPIVADAQELTVDEFIDILVDHDMMSEEKIEAAERAIGILGYERVATSVSPQCPQINRELAVGTRGADVVALQRFLAGQPHVYPQGITSGYYGSLSRAAVRRYQEGLGLAQTGSVGPQTRSALARCERVPAPTPTSAQPSGATTAPQAPAIAGEKLTFLAPPYVRLDPIAYGDLQTVYQTFYADYDATTVMARADILGDVSPAFKPDVVAFVSRDNEEPQLVVFEPAGRGYRVVLNDLVSVSRMYVLDPPQTGFAGYRDLLVITPSGREVRYTLTQEREYARMGR